MTGFAIAAGVSVLTIILLVVLLYTWVGRYREFRTPLGLGLLLFCVILLAENSIGLYFYFVADEMFYVDEPTIANLVAIQRILEFIAVSAFTYVSLR